MKTIYSALDGKLTITEEDGVVKLNFAAAESVGGGEAAGILKIEGQGSIILDGQTGLKLGEALVNHHIPAPLLPLTLVVEGVVNQAIAAIE